MTDIANEGTRILSMMLQSVQRVLVAGDTAHSLCIALNKAGKDAVEFVPGCLSNESAAFDAIVLTSGALEWTATLPLLKPDGSVYFLGNAASERPEEHGLRVYHAWPDEDITMAVRAEYDPVLHARRLFKEGNWNWALEVLMNVPDAVRQDPEMAARIAAETQLCYLAWDKASPLEGRLNRFCREQREFYKVTSAAPRHYPAYQIHAAFCSAVGRPDMAARVLRSIVHVAPHPSVEVQLAALEPATAPVYGDAPPECDTAFRPRLLFLCHRHSDYGMDTLYDGLCRMLGPERGTEFPWKPTLHGQDSEAAQSYPCTFELPGVPRDEAWVCARLRERYFDAVIYVDTLFDLERDMVRRIMDAADDTPLIVLDTWDEAGDYLADALAHLGRDSAAAYFKREMLAGVVYPCNTYPLPFSYPDDRVPKAISDERVVPFFWAGKWQDGMRRLYLEHIEKAFGLDLKRRYPQAEYAACLNQARVGLNLFGLGFDTVRYWELPAHGCMLLSERPPICIPYNFVDGESAMFFDDAAELEQKLHYLLDHPEEAQDIARAGRAHFLRYHTSSARARQFLGWMQQTLKCSAPEKRVCR